MPPYKYRNRKRYQHKRQLRGLWLRPTETTGYTPIPPAQPAAPTGNTNQNPQNQTDTLQGGEPAPELGIIPGVSDDPFLVSSLQTATSSAANNYNPGDTDPLTVGCPSFNEPVGTVPNWPIPTQVTFAWVKQVGQPMLDFGNTFRSANGLPDMIWDDYLILAAMRHANYIGVHDLALYNIPGPQGILIQTYGNNGLHREMPEGDETYGSYGELPTDRVANTGRIETGFTTEGAGWASGPGNGNPTRFLCQQNDYASPEVPGHFGPWVKPDTPLTHVGYGFNYSHIDGSVYHVFVYGIPSADPPIPYELYEYLPTLNTDNWV